MTEAEVTMRVNGVSRIQLIDPRMSLHGRRANACLALAVAQEGAEITTIEDLTADPPLTPGEIRERMSGNLCRCGAYVNIVRAITAVAGR
jgi:aerobic-type carbon monoxide dehydrogenase small subunit (CoxS/CutS family)